MSTKLGRPKTPASRAKTVLMGALYDPQEARTINAQIREWGLDKSKWLRKVTLDAARPVWIICDRWGESDLQGKTVEFKISVRGTRDYASGWGKFFVIKYRDGVKLAIQIHMLPPLYHRLYLNQEAADCIERHPDSAVADFNCFATVSGLREMG